MENDDFESAKFYLLGYDLNDGLNLNKSIQCILLKFIKK